MNPRSPQAVFAFYEAQNGLGEPGGVNDNWITQACRFVGSPWCLMMVSMAHLAAGFNPSRQVLDFGSPSIPPSWAKDLPIVDGLGLASDYRWGSAYTWAIVNHAVASRRWHPDLDSGRPGDTVIVNHNGRGGRRDDNSHGCTLISRNGDGSFLTWNGNVGDRVCKANWSAGVVEGFARPAYLFTIGPGGQTLAIQGDDQGLAPPPHIKEETDMALVWHKGAVYLISGGRRSKFGLQPAAVEAIKASAHIDVGGNPADDQSNLFAALD